MDQPWRIELFGGLRIRIEAGENSREITRFRTQKTAGLLAYLAFYRDKAHSREVLIDKLWPDSASGSRQNSLRVALSSLRHQLEPPGVTPGSILIADRVTVRLNPRAVQTDVNEFEDLIKSAGPKCDGPNARASLLRAVELYSGELLAGLYDEWIAAEQRRLEEVFFKSLDGLVQQLESEGDLNAARQLLQRGLAIDPLNEDITCHLIRLYVRAGQHHNALQQYRQLERLLEQELDTAPSKSTQELIRASVGDAGVELGTKAERKRPRKSPASKAARETPDSETAEVGVVRSDGEMNPAIPTGTVTFLAIDGLVAGTGDGAAATRSVEMNNGYIVRQSSNAMLAAFSRVRDAALSALALSRASNQSLSEVQQSEGDGVDGPAGNGKPVRKSGRKNKSDPGAAKSHQEKAVQPRMAVATADVDYRDGAYHSACLAQLDQILMAAHAGQIVCSDETASLLKVLNQPVAGLSDLGLFRLDGQDNQRRLYQLNDPRAARIDFPPLRMASTHSANLPVQFTRFFGREDDIAQVDSLLRESGRRLVTLSGPGGSGKTRLAVQVGMRILSDWRGIVWFVPLADLTEPRLLLHTVRDALRLPSVPGVEPLGQIVDFLSNQQAVLLMDNFEHLLEHGVEALETLLEKLPDLRILVTSQQRLNIAVEEEFVVSPLPSPSGDEELERLIQNPSVQLFVDRAQAVRTDFQITVANAGDIALLCKRLDGIPLALELAAARAQVLSPAQMLANLENRLDFFRNRFRNAVPRQRTLRAALDWSYQLLSLDHQEFLDRLSVFRGSWTLDAAARVAGSELSLDACAEYLDQLCGTSMVLAEDGSCDRRFRMLETIHDYAFERLKRSGELPAMQREHAEYMHNLAAQAGMELRGPRQDEWATRLIADQDNLRAALEWSLGVEPRPEATSGQNAELGLRLAIALWMFWQFQGNSTEGRYWLDRALSFPDAAPELRAEALYLAGRLAVYQNDFPAAQAYLEESLKLHGEMGNELGAAQARLVMALATMDGAPIDQTSATVEDALRLMRSKGDRQSLVYALNASAAVGVLLEDQVLVKSRIEEGLTLLREMQDKRSIAHSLSSLGANAVSRNDFSSAQSLLEESLAISIELNDEWGLAITRNTLAFVRMNQGEFEAARTLIEENLPIFRKLGIRARLAESLGQLGDVARYQGDYRRAATLLEESLALYDELDMKGRAAWSLRGMAWVAFHESRIEDAGQQFRQSLSLSHERNITTGVVHGLAGLAAVAGELRMGKRAAVLLGAAEGLRVASNSPVFPCERADYECSIALTRAVLGEEGFNEAWNQGKAVDLESAVAFAMTENTLP